MSRGATPNAAAPSTTTAAAAIIYFLLITSILRSGCSSCTGSLRIELFHSGISSSPELSTGGVACVRWSVDFFSNFGCFCFLSSGLFRLSFIKSPLLMISVTASPCFHYYKFTLCHLFILALLYHIIPAYL